MPKKPETQDVNQNVKRIFDEVVERSEQAPNRGTLKVVAEKLAGIKQNREKPPGVKLKSAKRTGVKLKPNKKAR